MENIFIITAGGEKIQVTQKVIHPGPNGEALEELTPVGEFLKLEEATVFISACIERAQNEADAEIDSYWEDFQSNS